MMKKEELVKERDTSDNNQLEEVKDGIEVVIIKGKEPVILVEDKKKNMRTIKEVPYVVNSYMRPKKLYSYKKSDVTSAKEIEHRRTMKDFEKDKLRITRITLFNQNNTCLRGTKL